MEHTSKDVLIGKVISKNTYKSQNHEIYISDFVSNVGVLDFYDRKTKTIHEIKKSKKMEELHIWQVKYYIYLLEKIGVFGVKGKIDYPKLRKIIDVELTNEDREKIKEIIKEINEICRNSNVPPVINKPYCKKCSYYEFCYS